MKIEIKYSTSWEDITALVERDSFKRTQKLHNNLKPTINVLKMTVKKNVSLMNAITNSNSVYVRVYEDDGITFFFYGKVKNSHKIKVQNRAESLELEVTDLAYLLKEELKINYDYSGIKVYDSNDTANSLVHKMIELTLYSQSLLPDFLINIELEHVHIEEGKTVEEVLTDLLASYGYVYNVEIDGKMKFYPFSKDVITPTFFLSNGNMLNELKYEKNEAQNKSTTIEWKPILFETQRLLVSDTSQSDSVHKCNIQIAPHDYYPVDSNTSDTYVDYQYDENEILKVENVNLVVEKDSDIDTDRFTPEAEKALISFYNTNSQYPKNITRLDIYGDVYYKKPDINTSYVHNGEDVDGEETVEAPYIFEKSHAQQLAQWRANFWKYADWKYICESRVKIPIGDFVSLTDTVMGISTTAQVIEIKDDFKKVYQYTLIGASEYVILPDTHDELNYTPSPPIQEIPVDVAIEGVVTEDVYFVREQQVGVTDPYTTIPTVPVIHEINSQFKALEIVWNKQMNLRGFKEYQLQVSKNQTDWYALGSDGNDWKYGGVDGYTALAYPRLVHVPISASGTADNPLPTTLYYRVRQRTESDLYSDWSAVMSGTTSLIETADIPANSITANKVSASFLDTVVASISDNLTIDQDTGWTTQKNNTRAFLNEREIAIQKNSPTGWNNISSISYDDEYSGSLNLGEYVELKTGSANDPTVSSSWFQINAGSFGPYLISQAITYNEYDEIQYTFLGTTDFDKDLQRPAVLTLYRSTDGNNWSTIVVDDAVPGMNSYAAPVYHDGVWYWITMGYKSLDNGLTWEKMTTTFPHPDLAVLKNSLNRQAFFKFGGYTYWTNGNLYRTSDFETYEQVIISGWQQTDQIRVVNNRIVLIGATTSSSNMNCLAYSNDGINWTFYTSPDTYEIKNVDYSDIGKYFMTRGTIGGSVHNGGLYYSYDLINWTTVYESDPADNYIEYSAEDIRCFGRYIFLNGRGYENNHNPPDTKNFFIYSDDYGDTWKKMYVPLYENSFDTTHDYIQIYHDIQLVGETVALSATNLTIDGTTYIQKYGLYTASIDDLDAWTLQYEEHAKINIFSFVGYLFGTSQRVVNEYNPSARVTAGVDNKTNDLHINNTGGKVYINGQDLETIGVPAHDSTLITHQYDHTLTGAVSTGWTDGWITENFQVPAKSVINTEFRIPFRTSGSTSEWGNLIVRVWVQKNDDGQWIDLGASGYYGGTLGVDGFFAYHNNIIQDYSDEQDWFWLKYKFSFMTDNGACDVNPSSIGFEGNDLDTSNDWYYSSLIVTTFTGITGPRGFRGIPGEQGIQGIQGVQGEKGTPGVTAEPFESTDQVWSKDQAVLFNNTVYIATVEGATGYYPNESPQFELFSLDTELQTYIQAVEVNNQAMADNNTLVSQYQRQVLDNTNTVNQYIDDVQSAVDRLNPIVIDDWHYVGEVGEPAFENGYSNDPYGTGVAFRKDLLTNTVHFKGTAQGSTTGIIFTLPEGYRPESDIYVGMVSSGPTATRMDIHSDGSVINENGGYSWFAFEGLSFSVGGIVPIEGLKGDKGDTGPADFNWTEGQSSERNQMVGHTGTVWKALKDNTNVEPGTDPTVWEDAFPNKGYAMHIQHKVAPGVASGTVTANIWNKSPFNHVEHNTIDGAFLDDQTYEFTLPTGRYFLTGFRGLFYTNAYAMRLYNVTDDTSILGMNGYTDVGDGYNSEHVPIQAVIEIDDSKVFRLEVYPQTTRESDGWGFSTNSYGGLDRVWADLLIISYRAPKGDKGDQGIQGIQGLRGERGQIGFSAAAYDPFHPYSIDEPCIKDCAVWISKTDSNQGNTPALGSAYWESYKSEDGFPVGTVIMYDANTPLTIDGITVTSGASGVWIDNTTIPGWFACVDGNQDKGCPNLVDRFVMGKVISGNGTTGGSNTHTLLVEELPSHSHVADHNHTTNNTDGTDGRTYTNSASHYHYQFVNNHASGSGLYISSSTVPGCYTSEGSDTEYRMRYSDAGYGYSVSNANVGRTGYNLSSHYHKVDVNTEEFSTEVTGGDTPIDIRPAHYSVIYIRKCS